MLTLPVDYSEKLATVERVDLHRYVGKWYTIASFPQLIAPLAHNTIVEYKLTNKGNLKVSKSFKSISRIVEDIILHGTAFIQENSNNAKLRIQYLWPFTDTSWVIDLADDYSYTVLSNPARTSLTILSRNLKMDSAIYSAILDRIKNMGFNIERLRLNPEFKKDLGSRD